MKRLVLAAALALLAAAPAQAREALSQFGGWYVFRDQRPERLCYVLAEPASTTYPKSAPRQSPYLTISVWPRRNVRGQLFFSPGYPLRADAAGRITIGGANFAALQGSEGAWIAETAQDARALQALRNGQSVVFEGVTARGNRWRDRYDLTGFSAALDAALKACAGS
jgi:hypothetical protein